MITKNSIVTFKDEWNERDRFGYSKYKITYLSSCKSKATVQELKTKHLYTKVNVSDLYQLTKY